MTRPEREAVKAAGALFDRYGWRWTVERRTRHVIMTIQTPDGLASNLIITAPRAGTGPFIAAAGAKRLLNKHGIRHAS